MTRLSLFAAALAAFLAFGLAQLRAECLSGTLLDTCLDDDGATPLQGDGEEYERLDGGSAGHAFSGPARTLTIGDTVLTLSKDKTDESQPWQPFNRPFGDSETDWRREDRPKTGGLDPAQVQCYADGCY